MSEFERGTVLAFDLGLKRTGVASGELGIGVAHALSVIHADSTDARLSPISTDLPPVLDPSTDVQYVCQSADDRLGASSPVAPV